MAVDQAASHDPSAHVRARRMFRTFLAEQRGVAALEFALIAVPFFALLFSVIETGTMMLLGVSVEHTTQQIARLIKTGQVQAYNIQNAADFRSQLLCPATGQRLLPAFMVCDRLVIDVRTSTSLATADLSNDFYKGGASQEFCLGGPQSIVIVRVAYSFPSILPILSIVSGGGVAQTRAGLVNDVPNFPGWNHLMFDAAAFENEISGGGTQAACT